MSIFKESFPPYIKKQIERRQNIIGQEKRDKDFFTYTTNKQCVLRMSSGVDIENNDMLEEGEYAAGVPAGGSIAEQYILEGGIPSNFSGNTESGFTSTPRGGFAKKGGVYGDPDVRADAKDGFGIVPMPGIIDANIRTKSAYGSLKTGKVKFIAHNQRQLEILELLYMRPGYTLLLEWQWSPFIDNDGNTSNKIYGVKDFFDKNMSTPRIQQQIHLNRITSGGNYDAIIGYCKNFSYTLRDDGGYDCETEIIAKGEILESLKMSERSQISGGDAEGKTPMEDLFDEIIEWSDQVDEANDFNAADALNVSIATQQEAEKLVRKTYNKGANLLKWVVDGATDLAKSTTTYIDDKTGTNLSKFNTKIDATGENINKNIDGYKVSETDLLTQDLLIDPEDIKEENMRASLKVRLGLTPDLFPNGDELFPLLIPKDSNFFSGLDDTTLDFSGGENTSSGEDGESISLSELDYNTTYIRWDVLASVINTEMIPLHKKTGKPIFTIQTCHVVTQDTTPTIKPLLYSRATPPLLDRKIETINGKALNWDLTDISVNPSVCLLPHLMYDFAAIKGLGNNITNQNQKGQPCNGYWAEGDLVGPGTPWSGWKIPIQQKISDTEKRYNIGNIYFGVEYLRYTFRDMYYTDEDGVNPDFNLLKYLKKIWNDVNQSTGGSHQFEFNVDHTMTDQARVIDMQASEEDLIESVHELKIQSPDSIVRNIAYNSSIPKALTSTIAIAAQAPDSIDNLDQVSFAAINKGIVDRFTKSVVASQQPTQEDINGWTAKFNEWMRDLYLGINYQAGSRDATTMEIAADIVEKKSDAAVEGTAYEDLVDLDKQTDEYNVVDGKILIGKYHPDNRTGGGILSNYQYDVFTGRQASKYDSDEKKVISPAKISEARGALKDIQKAIMNLSKVYGKDGIGEDGFPYYKGQPLKNPKQSVSSIIPLKFNAKMDGIGGIVIGNVFKLPKSRLPKGYRGKDVHFIVMGEEQSIKDQNWTTTITGQITLLGKTESSSGDDGLGSWIKNYTIDNIPEVIYDPNEDQVEELEGGPGAGSTEALGPTNGLFNPLDSIRFTTQYGQLRKIGKGAGSEGPTGVYRRHRGCDLGGKTGDKLYSMGDGIVSYVDPPTMENSKTGCGGTIRIKYEGDASGIESQYCHCSAVFVKKDEKVTAKQHVGNMGGEPGTPGAGNTTGAHLHLSIMTAGSVDWKTSDLQLGHRFGKGGKYTDKSSNKLKGTEGFSANGTVDPAQYLIKT